jgi:hypothetical protein
MKNTAANTGLAKVAVQCSADTFTNKLIYFKGFYDPFGVVVK